MFSKLAINFTGRVAVSLCRAFCAVEKSKIKAFSADRNVCLPFFCTFMPRNALVSRSVVQGLGPVEAILLMRNFAKVFQSVVGSLAIYVVNFTKWPSPMVHGPYNPVRRNYFSINTDLDVSIADGSGFLSRFSPSCCMLPNKIAALFVVREPLMKKINGDFAHSHHISQFLSGVKYGIS